MRRVVVRDIGSVRRSVPETVQQARRRQAPALHRGELDAAVAIYREILAAMRRRFRALLG